jgi:hypothetical protein
MCDALGERCSGYQLLASGNCGALLGAAGSEPASADGHKLFAKATSACEAAGSCAVVPPSTPPAGGSSGAAGIAAGFVCAIALAVVGALALRRRRLALGVDGGDDGKSFVAAGPASERVLLEAPPRSSTVREAERKHQEAMETVEARLRQ